MPFDRRTLLQASTAVLTAAAINPARAADPAAARVSRLAPPDVNSGESLALAKYVVETRFEDLPPHVVEMTKRSILDAIGVSLAASGLEPACKPFVDMALEAGGTPQSTIFGFGTKVPASWAAFANGSMAHAMDYEDIHDASGTHPNGPTVPAAFAVAEALGGVSGKELITAVAVGCDLVTRLSLSRADRSAPVTDEGNPGGSGGFYPPAIVGTFGAAAAAGRLLKLTPVQMLDCFSLALCSNSVSYEIVDSPDSYVRAIRDGLCAQSGVQAAYLAKKGVKGFDKPFEGRYGFYAMYTRGMYMPGVLTADLGKNFGGGDVSFKAWPACRGTHIYIQAALEFQREKKLDPKDIVAINTSVTRGNQMLVEPAASKAAPRTSIDAKFSIPYTIGLALVDKEVTLQSFDDKARAKKPVLDVAGKVAYKVNGAVARADGGKFIEFKMKDGSSHERSIGPIFGSPKNPLPDAVFMQKFLDCGINSAKPLVASQLSGIASQVLDLQSLENTSKLKLSA